MGMRVEWREAGAEFFQNGAKQGGRFGVRHGGVPKLCHEHNDITPKTPSHMLTIFIESY
ncbi:MAG: hypothetical protein JO141_12465 [Bradyrhizobium sp.]|nr:hypothetical protein [Bradyrhizobium sp.]